MELSQGTHKAFKFAPQDFDYLSNMPDNVITDILDRLPVQDAVRTSMLSRNWRFNWTMLSKLEFEFDFFEYLSKTKQKKGYERIITRLLLSLKGVVTKFDIFILEMCSDEELAHWILILIKKGIKDLTIWKDITGDPLKLPSGLFSCLELTNLVLHDCYFDPPASFHGFPSLLCLELHNVVFANKNIGQFFTQCPMIEILNLEFSHFEGRAKLVDIAKLSNLKTLTLCLSSFDEITSSRCLFELVGFFPKLQELELHFEHCELITEEDGVLERSSSTFLCLKTLKLLYVDLDDIMLSFVFEILRSSPNLQSFEIEAGEQYDVAPLDICFSELDYNTMEMLHLRSVVFSDFEGSKNEVCLIKYLLACSPFLKMAVIHHYRRLKSEEMLMFMRKLLKLQRASTVAEIDFK